MGDIERLRRRTATARRMLRQVAGGSELKTPALTDEQASFHGPVIAEYARVVVQEWSKPGGVIPPPLSEAVMDLKRALVQATATAEEVSDA